MNIFKNVVSWLSLYLVAGMFFLTANVVAFSMAINPDNVKRTLKEQGTYGKIVPAVLSTATYSSDITQGQQLPLNEPWVKEAAVKSFPSTDLERKGETVIDATFKWLNGDTEQPEYTLDFTSNKQNLATEIGNGTETRLASLPKCGRNNIPSSVDAFRIECLPPGATAKAIADRASSQISNDQGFLKDPIITSGNLADASQGNVSDNPFAQLEGLRSFYQNKGLLVWLLPALAVAFAALGVFIARDRLKALGRLMRSFISSGVGLTIFGLLIGFGFENAVRAVSRDAVSREIISPVFISLAQQFRTVYFIFAGIAFVLALILFVVRRRLQARPSRVI